MLSAAGGERVAGRQTWSRFNISDSLMACFRMLSRSASAMASASIVSVSGTRAAMRAKDASTKDLYSHSIDNVTTIMVYYCSYYNGLLPGFIGPCEAKYSIANGILIGSAASAGLNSGTNTD